jgi:hypothetical protein
MKSPQSTPRRKAETRSSFSEAAAYPAQHTYPTGPETSDLASYPAVQRYAMPGDGGHQVLAPIQNSPISAVQRMHDPRLAPWQHRPLDKDAVMQLKFKVCGITFEDPSDYKFSAASAEAATDPIPRGHWADLTGVASSSGVEVGDVGSYGAIQHAEATGDGLTGDHQPSGAAIKEAIREMLHTALHKPLTRAMAKNAYKRAITVVVTDVWHKAQSRTYGGRNSKMQIDDDASDLTAAAIEDWKKLVPELKNTFTNAEIVQIWDSLNAAREAFFEDGDTAFEPFS